jgi:hypothetical protein
MDVPILTAVIGVGGSLMGTIIGGCLTVYSNFFLNRRRERAEFRIGCRLISGELRENHVVVITLLQTRRWWDFDQLEPGMEAWKDYRHVLAAYLPSEVWHDVQQAVQAVHQARLVRTAASVDNPKPAEPEPNRLARSGHTNTSAVRANLDDPPIHIRPICSRRRGFEGQEPNGFNAS